jgi:hypothetical protein
VAERKWEVVETVYRYAVGIDTRDWALYRSIFADEVLIDFSSYSGEAAATITGDEWLARVLPLFTGLAATQHSMTNPLVELGADGASATCRMYMQAHHVLDASDPGSWCTIGGYYDDALVLADGRWRITGVRLTVLWRAGDAGIMPIAAQAGTTRLAAGGDVRS